jgi:predicted Fe-Mo cluster-binding NifX family protein
MRVGIPIWNGRVSPVLDVAKRLIVVDIEDGVESRRAEASIDDPDIAVRTRWIKGLGVEFLICGAVSWPFEAMLTAAGVQVAPQICGSVEEVLQAYLVGRLADEAFLMPGCCGRRRRFAGGRRRGGRPGAGAWRRMARDTKGDHRDAKS